MSYYDKKIDIETLTEVARIFTEDGSQYIYYHDQGCCEEVDLNDATITVKCLRNSKQNIRNNLSI